MLGNKFLYLLGPSVSGSVDPSTNEPYHVVFNFNVANNDPATYIKPSDRSEYGLMVRSLEPDSDYDPLPDYPYMYAPADLDIVALTARMSYVIGQTQATARIDNVQQFAHPDRRGKLPKSFQTRIGYEGTGFFPECWVFKLNLNAAGTEYVGLRANDVNEDGNVNLSLEYSLDGTDVVTFPGAELNESLQGQTGSSIQFVIREDRLEAYVGQPGTLVDSLTLPRPLVINGPVSLEIFKMLNTNQPNVSNVLLGSLLVFDAYL